MPDEPSTPPPYDPGRRVNTGLAGETTRNEGSTILPEARQRPLEVIGDFAVLGKLGQGGMGAVYRARQISLDRQVALKILPPNFEADADYVARFQREARIAASLNHANLVKVYASGAADGCHYIAMELIEGETLSQWLKRAALPPLEALRITLDVARALECGWRTAQLIHRDIKPGNVFLSTTGEVKLGDLGLAKIVGSDTTGLTHTGMAMGTPHYISPEQARGDKDLDIRADIYSLGCTLYQMLTGQTPYIGTEPMVVMNQHINAPPPAILKVMPQCPIPLARLVSKMLKKPRRERYANYSELIVAIETVQAQLDPTRSAPSIPAISSTPTAPPPSTPLPPAPAAPPQPKSRMPVYGVGGVLVLALAAFFLWPKQEKLTQAQKYARAHASELAAARADAELLAKATKDAPFENTLGMKFVPVPILSGPTTGHPVLFSVWDTRVQDYEVFAKETKRAWEKASWQGPAHPAVSVTWDDAQAFCAWLTERERKAGKLGANAAYRLPSDHEWSCAVGIGELENAAELPVAKSLQIDNTYPWGTQWPPPAGAGNYGGEELQRAMDAGKYTYLTKTLPGYHDGYVETSPVGSFAANRFGLYDMGGNVNQWCADWYDQEHSARVLRGGSWTSSDRRYGLLSSTRAHNPPESRRDTNGFRSVLGAPVPPTGAAAANGGARSVAPQASAGEGGTKVGAGSPVIQPPLVPAADPWQDVLHNPGFKSRGAELTPQGLHFSGSGTTGLTVAARDSAVRIISTFDPATKSLYLRVRGSARGAYVLYLRSSGSALRLVRSETGQKEAILLREMPLPSPVQPGQEYSMELRVVGSTLSAKFDGNFLGEVVDTTFPSGTSGLDHSDNSPALVKTFEYLNLDSRPAGP